MRLRSILFSIAVIALAMADFATVNAQGISHDPGTTVRFEHLTVDEGLSQNAGLALLQDSRGYLWIGTQDGLNRYDGYNIKIYKNNPDDPDSISYNGILSLLEDPDGYIWIGTWGGGLNRYDPQTGKFTRFLPNEQDPGSLSNAVVPGLFIDSGGVLWVATLGGLDRYDRLSGKFDHFRNDPANTSSLSSNVVSVIYEYPQGTLWIGTGAIGTPGAGLNRMNLDTNEIERVSHNPSHPECLIADHISDIIADDSGIMWIANGGYSLPGMGIDRYNPATGECISYRANPDGGYTLSDDNVVRFALDKQGTLWATTWGGGLNFMDLNTPGKFLQYFHNPADPDSLNNNALFDVLVDRSDILWVGSLNNGINKLVLNNLQFRLYQHNPDDPNSISSDLVGAFAEDRFGTIWVGTWRAGLNRFDRGTGKFVRYQNDPENPESLGYDTVMSIFPDSDGTLWISTLGGGIDQFNPRTGKFKHFVNNPDNPNSLIDNSATNVVADNYGNLWIGTLNGLDRYEKETGKFHHFQNDPNKPGSLSLNPAVALFLDGDILWVGTWGGGLNRLDLSNPANFDPATAQFEVFANDPKNPLSISDNSVWVIHKARNGVMWFATQAGLNRFNDVSGLFKSYREKDGLRNETILGILEDDQGNLWLTTNNGLAKFDPAAEAFQIFDRSDGLQGNEFNSNAFFRSSKGEFYVGGSHGFNVFNPENVQYNLTPPPVVITQFNIFNEPVQVDLSGDNPIELTYKQNFFSFDFAALDFQSPTKNQYAYMLEGFDPGWVNAGNRRYAGYTNLPGGNYVFKVKASNGSGVWNETGISIPLVVTPPFWQTPLFIGIVLIAVGSFMAAGYQWRVNSIQAQNRRLEDLVYTRTGELRQANALLEVEVEQRKRAEAALAERAEAQLRESETRFKAMFDHAAIGMALVGLDRKVITANPALEKMTQRSVEELRQISGAELTYPEDSQIGLEEFRAMLAGQIDSFQMERRYVRKNGEIYWVRLTNSIVRTRDGSPEYLVVMVEDIDRHKRVQAQLMDSESRFRAMFENTAVGVAVMSLDRKILQINAAAERIVGYTNEEIQTINPSDFAIEEDRYLDREYFAELVEGKRNQYQIEKRYIHKDSHIFWGRVTFSIVKNQNQEPLYIIGLIEDIDQEKRAQEKMAAQEAEYLRNLEIRVVERTKELQETNQRLQLEIEQRQKAEMALAHKAAQEAVVNERTRLARDLHDAVTQTLFSATLIADVLPDIWDMNQQEGKKRLEELRQLTRGALAEMRTLLVELRPNALVDIPLSTLMRQLSDAVIGRARLDLQLLIEGDRRLPPEVQIVFYRIAQEALNNIVKHARATQAVITLRLGEQVRLSIEDNGRGFNPEGVTADHLGLKIMRERAEGVGARFIIYSEPGEGTQISIVWEKPIES